MQESNVLADFQTLARVDDGTQVIDCELRRKTVFQSQKRDFDVAAFLSRLQEEVSYFEEHHSEEPKVQMTRHLIALIASPRNIAVREDGYFDAQLFGVDIECIDEKGYVCTVSVKK